MGIPRQINVYFCAKSSSSLILNDLAHSGLCRALES